MKGREVIKVNTTLTLDELEAFMNEHWNVAEYGSFVKGRPTPASIEEYIILPATDNWLVIVYPRKGKVIFSGAETPQGVALNIFTSLPTRSVFVGASQAAASIDKTKELRTVVNDIIIDYANHMKQILREAGML